MKTFHAIMWVLRYIIRSGPPSKSTLSTNLMWRSDHFYKNKFFEVIICRKVHGNRILLPQIGFIFLSSFIKISIIPTLPIYWKALFRRNSVFRLNAFTYNAKKLLRFSMIYIINSVSLFCVFSANVRIILVNRNWVHFNKIAYKLFQ